MTHPQHADTPPAIRVQRLAKGAGLPLPRYMTAGAAGADIAAAVDAPVVIAPSEWAAIDTGFAFQIPTGYELQIRPRSSLALRGVTILNTPACLDEDFRGQARVLLINHSSVAFTVTRGDPIAQIILAPIVRAGFDEVTELEPTERGSGGFGSTD